MITKRSMKIEMAVEPGVSETDLVMEAVEEALSTISREEDIFDAFITIRCDRDPGEVVAATVTIGQKRVDR